MPGRKSRDRKGRSPRLPVISAGGGNRLDGQARGARSNREAQAPLPDATGTKRTCRQKTAFGRRTSDPERARRNRGADGSPAANPRPGEAPNRVRRGSYEILIAHRESEGTPKENPAAPTAVGRRRDPLPARLIPGRLATP